MLQTIHFSPQEIRLSESLLYSYENFQKEIAALLRAEGINPDDPGELLSTKKAWLRMLTDFASVLISDECS